MVHHSAVAEALEVQRSLERCIAYHARGTRKLVAIQVHALDEEIGVVETCCRIFRMVILHILMEIPAVLLFNPQSLRSQGIVIERRRDISVVLVEVV